MLAVVPARAGSQGIPNKNIFPLCGKPLIEYTLDAIADSDLEQYVISSDCDKIIKDYDGVLRRPKDLAKGQKGSIIKVLQYILEIDALATFDSIMLLQPTSPLRTARDINEAIESFYESGADSLYSGYRLKLKTKNKTYDKSDGKYHFQRNGAIFIAKRRLIEKGKLWDDDVFEFEMPESRSVDIDTYDDMYHAECLIKGGILKHGDLDSHNLDISILH